MQTLQYKQVAIPLHHPSPALDPLAIKYEVHADTELKYNLTNTHFRCWDKTCLVLWSSGEYAGSHSNIIPIYILNKCMPQFCLCYIMLLGSLPTYLYHFHFHVCEYVVYKPWLIDDFLLFNIYCKVMTQEIDTPVNEVYKLLLSLDYFNKYH